MNKKVETKSMASAEEWNALTEVASRLTNVMPNGIKFVVKYPPGSSIENQVNKQRKKMTRR